MEKPETCVQTRSESDIVTQHHTASSSVLGKGGVLLIPSPPPPPASGMGISWGKTAGGHSLCVNGGGRYTPVHAHP